MAGLRCMYWGHRQKGVRSKRNYFNEPKKCCTTQNSFKVILVFRSPPGSTAVHASPSKSSHDTGASHGIFEHTPPSTKISEVPRLPSHASRAGQVMEGRSTSTMESWLMLAREASSRPTPAPHPVFLAHLLLAQVHTTFRLRVAMQIVFE